MLIFHVTLVELLVKILKTGICPNKPQIWAKRAGRFAKGYTYFFTDYNDAVRWAFKMDWELNEGARLQGKARKAVAILRLDYSCQMEDDTHIEKAFGYTGQWLKTKEIIPPTMIHDITMEPTWRRDARMLAATGGRGTK